MMVKKRRVFLVFLEHFSRKLSLYIEAKQSSELTEQTKKLKNPKRKSSVFVSAPVFLPHDFTDLGQD